MSEPEKKYVLLTEERRRIGFSCQLAPMTKSIIRSLAQTRETSVGRTLDWLVKDYLATRELHEKIKGNKKSLQSLKTDERGMSHER